MKQTMTGEHHDLVVDGELTVNGAVRGVTVPSGCHVTVNGVLAGSISVAEDGGVMVYGTFTPESVLNDGIVMVGGIAMVDARDLDDLGHFALSPGTLIGDRGLQLQADGSLVRLEGRNHNVDIDGEVWCAWVQSEQRFVPMDELKLRNAEKPNG